MPVSMETEFFHSAAAIDGSREYARTILNSLSAHIAIIDQDGFILETNDAWKSFAESNKIRMRPDTLNVNYLDICDSALGESAEAAHAVADGIRAVIRGAVEEFVLDYSCHSPEEKRWFYMKAIRAVGSGPLKVVISHENITLLKTAEEQLRQREKELDQERTLLQEANAALRAVLREHEEQKQELEHSIFQNLRETVLPYVRRLKDAKQDPETHSLITLIEDRLDDLASPFLQRLYHLKALLTPQEMAIARLVKEGMTTKDMARLLNLSPTTISFHRRNLRHKLGLRNTSTNLRVHLLSLKE